MVIVHGRTNIEREVKRRLALEKSRLLRGVRGRQAKFLFVTVHTLNYGFAKQLLTESGESRVLYDMSVFPAMQCAKGILDTLMETKNHAIERTTYPEYLQILDELPNYFNIATYSLMLHTQKVEPIDKVRIEANEIDDFTNVAYREAVRGYVNSAQSDENWQTGYWTGNPKHRVEAGNMLGVEFKKAFGLEIRDLNALSQYLEDVVKGHFARTKGKIQVQSLPWLSITRDKLLEEMQRIVTPGAAQSWVKELEYFPGKDINRSPLLRIVEGGRSFYTIATWVVHPSHTFWGSWIYETFVRCPSSRALGKWSKGYGDSFEGYVDHVVSSTGPKVISIRKRQEISTSEYPEIADLIVKAGKKGGFELDRLILTETSAFLVSCKAPDFFYDQKIVSRNFFFPWKEIEKRIKEDVRYLTEIESIAKCVQRSNALRKLWGITNQKEIPVVVTSRIEPLCMDSIRKLYAVGGHVPEVEIIPVSKFGEFLKAHS